MALAIAGLGWLVYQLRIRRLRERYDLILAERSRIARELHDTLIQGFSGITMAMQALAGRLRSPQERETLDDIIRDAATCLRETRQSVAGLRAGHDSESGLSAAIGTAAREITDTKDVRLKLKLDKSTAQTARRSGIQPAAHRQRGDLQFGEAFRRAQHRSGAGVDTGSAAAQGA